MLLIVLSLVFIGLLTRELRSKTPISIPYVVILAALAIATGWPQLRFWYFERTLTTIARELSGNSQATVHCNTLFDTLFDEDIGVAGHANFTTHRLVMQYPRCSLLMSYLKHPLKASIEELISLNVLTHESMHAKGEKNEAKTECMSVQRNAQTAKLLGVPEYLAAENAKSYYEDVYLKLQHGRYFSKECAPGKALDEHLPDAFW